MSVKDGAKFGKDFWRCVRARPLVCIERQIPATSAAILSDLVDLDCERHDAVVFEATRGLRRQRTLMTAIRESVSLFTRDVVLARNVFGGQAHAEVHVRVVL